ncbi:MAG: right-handed parallel beta-helix repeat-containing protein [Fibrobacteres bacterium]|nr:right-handed parallel beta-helix repeat-containing protein [Fibrobacterota bacterium]
MKTLLLLSSLLFCSTYYVASNGDDSRSALVAGNPLTPWKTLSKISSTAFAPGDTILFKRGDTWEGTLTISSSGTAGNKITYGAYGTGANPSIQGKVAITGSWVNSGNGIYQTDFTGSIAALFINGRQLTLARYPNNGYLTIKDTINSTTLTCDELNSANWVGGMIHVKTDRWSLISKSITASSSSAKTLTINSAPTYGLKPQWGFFINNSLAALDTAGEWYQDYTSHKIYVKLEGNVAPSGIIEGVFYDRGIISGGKSNFTIQDLSISGYRNTCISINSGSNITVSRNKISSAIYACLLVDGTSSNLTISNNSIEGSISYGMLFNASNSSITGNIIRNIAILANFDAAGFGENCCSGLAIELRGSGTTLRENRIDSIGYIGVRVSNANCILEYNHITNCCLTKDDGAGIYAGWQATRTETGAAGTIIRKNIVTHTRSSIEGTPNKDYKPGEGIYIDDRGHDITIEDNTTAHCANNGIFLHNAKNIIVRRNNCFNNASSQIKFSEDAIVGSGYMENNRVTSNTFYSCNELQSSMLTSAAYTDTFLAYTDSNRYCNPYTDVVIRFNGSAYSLDSWSQTKMLDAHSSLTSISLPQFHVLDTTGINLINNGTFTSGISNWSSWPSAVSLSWDNNNKLDGGSMKVVYRNDSASSTGLVYPSAIFALTQGQYYLFSFTAISNKAATISATIREGHSPWKTLGLSKPYAINTVRSDFTSLFNATGTDNQCRVDFGNTKADSLYWLDNVSILPVAVTTLDPLKQSLLFHNPTMRDSSISLSGNGYKDINGLSVSGSILLKPFTSAILIADTAFATNMENQLLTKGPLPFTSTLTNNESAVKLSLSVNIPGRISIKLYNIKGQIISTVLNCDISVGSYQFTTNVADYAQGVLFLRIVSEYYSITKRICLVR